MKIDLAGPRSRGLAMGLNEFAISRSRLPLGQLAILLHGTACGRAILTSASCFWPVDCCCPCSPSGKRAATPSMSSARPRPSLNHCRTVRSFIGPHGQTGTFRQRRKQGSPKNNSNDYRGLFPMIFAAAGLGLDHIGVLAGLYPAVWGVSQLATGGLSDRVGRKWLIAFGMWVQARGLR